MIGGSLAINYGFAHSFWAIIAVGLVIFLTELPIAYYVAKYNIDMDLLTRGASFGYIGSTITSLIYASFTFSNLNRAAQLIQSFKQVAVDQSSKSRRVFNLNN